jgi:hypothetical protein
MRSRLAGTVRAAMGGTAQQEIRFASVPRHAPRQAGTGGAGGTGGMTNTPQAVGLPFLVYPNLTFDMNCAL